MLLRKMNAMGERHAVACDGQFRSLQWPGAMVNISTILSEI